MDPPSEENREFIRRGVPYEDAGARQMGRLRSLGVTDVVQIARVDGTEGEGQVLPPWCDEHQLGSIVVVATKDHSRRLRRVLDRAMKGHPTRATVQPARYSSFDPDRWWETRAASGQKSSSSRNSCSTLCCTRSHFEGSAGDRWPAGAAAMGDGASSPRGCAHSPLPGRCSCPGSAGTARPRRIAPRCLTAVRMAAASVSDMENILGAHGPRGPGSASRTQPFGRALRSQVSRNAEMMWQLGKSSTVRDVS